MVELEDFIKNNRQKFDSGNMPEELEAKVLDACRMNANRRKKAKVIHSIYAAISAAAVVILAATLLVRGEGEENTNEELEYRACMEEITEMAVSIDNHEVISLMTAAENIDGDIPIEEQIGSDIPKKERLRIIKEYYGHKAEGLKRIKALMANLENDKE